MIEFKIRLPGRQIGQLAEIGEKGWASDGNWQDEDYCIRKAIDEFIEKYRKGKKEKGEGNE